MYSQSGLRPYKLQGAKTMADSTQYELNAASLEARADALPKEETKVEEVKTETPETKVDADPKTETKVDVKDAVKPDIKDEKKAPNDPDEFKKFVTRTGQELADLKRQIENEKREKAELRELFEKASKKPIDWDAV